MLPAAVFAAVVLSPIAAVGSTFEDALLRERIENRLRADSRVQSYDFQVETNDGRVVLRGSPDSLESLAQAVSLALTTDGSVSVQAAVDVAPPAVDDQTLRDQAQAILSSMPGQSAAEARIRIQDQTAEVTGTFPSFAALNSVLSRLSRMEGLRSIRTEARLSPPVDIDDQYVLESVAKQLTFDKGIDADEIRIGVRNGHVWLEGDVADAYQRARAEMLTRYTTGVVGVTNRLQSQSEEAERRTESQPVG